jgi:hypothetical protein
LLSVYLADGNAPRWQVHLFHVFDLFRG